jgi:flagellar hook-length control protein FliK
MSLPSFLLNTTSTKSFAGAASAGTAVNNSRTAQSHTSTAGGDFRQAFVQAAGDAKAAVAEPPANMPEPAAVALNRLSKGEALSTEDRQLLRSALESGDLTAADLLQQLTPAVRQALENLLEGAGVELPSLEEHLPIEVLVDFLAGGNILPPDKSADAMNLAAGEVDGEEEGSLLMAGSGFPASFQFPAHFQNQGQSADSLTHNVPPTDLGQGKRVELGQQLGGNEEADDSVSAKTSVATLELSGNKGIESSIGKAIEPSTDKATLFSSAMVLEESAEPVVRSSFASPAELKPAIQESLPQAPLHPTRLQVSFGHAQWSEALAERAAWLAGQQIHSAELQLDPPELGPLQVRISVHQDQAVVSFVSANPQVREALDQTMGRLRELMLEQGMQLVDAGVSDQGREGRAEAEAAERSLQADGNPDENAETSTTVASIVADYGVDDFA